MIKDWIHKTLKSISNEFWGEFVEHPLLRRLLAIIVDYIIVMPFYFLVGYIYIRDFQKELTLDLPITLIYLTLLNSKYFGGQTIGKRIFKLRTTDQQGNQITLLRSLVRSLPISLLICGQLILLYFNQINDLSFHIAVVILIFISFGLVYFAVAKLNRQGLHDIIASTQVISKEARIQTSKNLDFKLLSGYLILSISYVGYLIYLWRVG
jgi:uncharacterized RDD family membrane protein YckC